MKLFGCASAACRRAPGQVYGCRARNNKRRSENSELRSDLYDGEAPVSANGLANDLDPVFELRRHPSSQHHAAKLHPTPRPPRPHPPPLPHQPPSTLPPPRLPSCFSCNILSMLTVSVPGVAGRLGSNRCSDWRRRGPSGFPEGER